MTIQEIKTAVDAGMHVQWVNPSYKVIKDKNGEYLIMYTINQNCTGLTNKAGDTLNGEESEFSIIPLNGYKAFYNKQETDIYADTQYAAKLLAIEHFKVKKSQQHMVTVVLCEKGGEQVIHKPDF